MKHRRAPTTPHEPREAMRHANFANRRGLRVFSFNAKRNGILLQMLERVLRRLVVPPLPAVK
jgi:hypothetical protein